MFDVIIIGAGLAGLQAALTAQKGGLSVVIVEARDRVGGKVWSVPLASRIGMADLGAAWINDALQPRVSKYVKEFGLHIEKQRTAGNAIIQEEDDGRLVFPNGTSPEFSIEEKTNLEMVRNHIQTESLKKGAVKVEDDAVTLDQYVRKLGAIDNTAKMIGAWSQVMQGVESTQQSAAYFIDYCRRNNGLLVVRGDDHTGANHMRIVEGAQSIPDGLVTLIGQENIHLASPVASVNDRTHHVEVTTSTGKIFVGRKCIITLPSTMYQDLNITPALPPGSGDVASSTRLGNYNKAILCYKNPWWRDSGYNGFVLSFKGPVVVVRDTSVDSKGFYSLTCFVNADKGEKWSTLYPHERRKIVFDQLAQAYQVGTKSELYRPIEVFDLVWKHEIYSKGAISPVTALGDLTKDSLYGKPVGNLYFAGTEFATNWKGYMEGALESGDRTAHEVVTVSTHHKTLSRL